MSLRKLIQMVCLAVLLTTAGQVQAALMSYDTGSNTWSVTGWAPNAFAGYGAFAPSSFTGYTSDNGVAMLRNDNRAGWWIGDVEINTASSYWASDTSSITVTGATWGGIVKYNTTQLAGSRFYAATDNPGDIIDATSLSIGDSVNGVFTWSGSDLNKQLNYNAPSTAPVPEPTSLAIFAIGACGVGLARRRRREKQ